MGLTADIRLRSVMLGIERVEVLLEAMVGRHPRGNRAADRLARPFLHGRPSEDCLPRPKNRGPDQRVPVMAKATWDRLGEGLPFQGNPSPSTMTPCRGPSPPRVTRGPRSNSALGPVR